MKLTPKRRVGKGAGTGRERCWAQEVAHRGGETGQAGFSGAGGTGVHLGLHWRL